MQNSYRNGMIAQNSNGVFQKRIHRGINKTFVIVSNGSRAPEVVWEDDSRLHQFDDARRLSQYKLEVLPSVPYGTYMFYVGAGFPVSLVLTRGQKPVISLRVTSGKQSKPIHITKVVFQPGWITVNNADVHSRTLELVKRNLRDMTGMKSSKQATLSDRFLEAYGEKVFAAVSKKRRPEKFFSILMDRVLDGYQEFDILQALTITNDHLVMINLLALNSDAIGRAHAKRVCEKVRSWSYLQRAMPDVTFYGHLDAARHALALYVVKWKDA